MGFTPNDLWNVSKINKQINDVNAENFSLNLHHLRNYHTLRILFKRNSLLIQFQYSTDRRFLQLVARAVTYIVLSISY